MAKPWHCLNPGGSRGEGTRGPRTRLSVFDGWLCRLANVVLSCGCFLPLRPALEVGRALIASAILQAGLLHHDRVFCKIELAAAPSVVCDGPFSVATKTTSFQVHVDNLRAFGVYKTIGFEEAGLASVDSGRVRLSSLPEVSRNAEEIRLEIVGTLEWEAQMLHSDGNCFHATGFPACHFARLSPNAVPRLRCCTSLGRASPLRTWHLLTSSPTPKPEAHLFEGPLGPNPSVATETRFQI